jgi:antitoxin (DNA-binding transcriptional repressor) of toxin-antitoxin stability system
MAVATVAELSERTAEYLEIVELGGRVIIRDNGEIVGEIVPTPQAQYRLSKVLAGLPAPDADAAHELFLGEGSIDHALMAKVKETGERVQTDPADPQAALKARLAQLIADGTVRPPLEPLTDDFFREPRPEWPGEGSLLEDLLAMRRESKW